MDHVAIRPGIGGRSHTHVRHADAIALDQCASLTDVLTYLRLYQLSLLCILGASGAQTFEELLERQLAGTDLASSTFHHHVVLHRGINCNVPWDHALMLSHTFFECSMSFVDTLQVVPPAPIAPERLMPAVQMPVVDNDSSSSSSSSSSRNRYLSSHSDRDQQRLGERSR